MTASDTARTVYRNSLQSAAIRPRQEVPFLPALPGPQQFPAMLLTRTGSELILQRIIQPGRIPAPLADSWCVATHIVGTIRQIEIDVASIEAAKELADFGW
jgi:hypothetical protein